MFLERPPNTQGDSNCHRHPGGLPSACESRCWPGRFSKGLGPPKQPSPGGRPDRRLPDTALGGDPSPNSGTEVRRRGALASQSPAYPQGILKMPQWLQELSSSSK